MREGEKAGICNFLTFDSCDMKRLRLIFGPDILIYEYELSWS